MQRSALCRSRRELSNEYLLTKFGFSCARIPGSLFFFLREGPLDLACLLASIQPRTSLVKLARSPRTDPGSLSLSLLQIPQVPALLRAPRPGVDGPGRRRVLLHGLPGWPGRHPPGRRGGQRLHREIRRLRHLREEE